MYMSVDLCPVYVSISALNFNFTFVDCCFTNRFFRMGVRGGGGKGCLVFTFVKLLCLLLLLFVCLLVKCCVFTLVQSA